MPPLTYNRSTGPDPLPRKPRYSSDNVLVTMRRDDAERLLHDGIITDRARVALRYALEVVA